MYGIAYAREPIREMLQDFHLLTGIRVAYYPISTYPDIGQASRTFGLASEERIRSGPVIPEKVSSFCDSIRKDPVLDARCRTCDWNAFRKAETSGEPILYHCHAGLLEAVAPILDGDRCLGYLMMGQILDRPPDTAAWRATTRSFPPETVIDPAWVDAFHQLHHMSVDRIQASFRLLTRQARYILSSAWVRSLSMPLLARLEEEIKHNMEQSPGTSALASALGMSASRLTHVVKELTGHSVTQFSRNLRLTMAKDLIQGTRQSLQEIAGRTGWQDARYFSRVFRQQTGLSPQEFRSRFVHLPAESSLPLQDGSHYDQTEDMHASRVELRQDL